jgi:hypothetical protein
MVKTGQLESTNKPSKVKPMRILQDSIFHKHTLFLLGHRNDFLSLRTVSVLKLPEMHIFNLLQVISKRVKSEADKFSHYVPNTVVAPPWICRPGNHLCRMLPEPMCFIHFLYDVTIQNHWNTMVYAIYTPYTMAVWLNFNQTWEKL